MEVVIDQVRWRFEESDPSCRRRVAPIRVGFGKALEARGLDLSREGNGDEGLCDLGRQWGHKVATVTYRRCPRILRPAVAGYRCANPIPRRCRVRKGR